MAIAVMRSYGIEGVGAVHAVRIYRSALHGFAAQELSGAFGMAESVDESFRIMVDLLDQAFRDWTPRLTAARAEASRQRQGGPGRPRTS